MKAPAPGAITSTPGDAGAKAGAATAALLCFVAVIVPETVRAFGSPLFQAEFRAGWLLEILFYTLRCTALAAVPGCIAGVIAARTRYPWSGALVGAAFSLPVLLVLISIIFIEVDPLDQALGALVQALREVAIVMSGEARAPEQSGPLVLVLRVALFIGSIGAVSGGVAWRAANRRRDPEGGRVFQVSLVELVLLVAAIAAHLGAYTVSIRWVR